MQEIYCLKSVCITYSLNSAEMNSEMKHGYRIFSKRLNSTRVIRALPEKNEFQRHKRFLNSSRTVTNLGFVDLINH